MEIVWTINWPALYPGLSVRYLYTGLYHDKSHQDGFSKSILLSKDSDQSALFSPAFTAKLDKLGVVPDLVVPIPSSRQIPSPTVSALAQIAANHFRTRFSPLLQKKAGSAKLATIKSHLDRHKAVGGSIVLKEPLPANTKTVLLVDDIKTTGMTTMECAKVLTAAGVKNIYAIFIAENAPHTPSPVKTS